MLLIKIDVMFGWTFSNDVLSAGLVLFSQGEGKTMGAIYWQYVIIKQSLKYRKIIQLQLIEHYDVLLLDSGV